MRWCSTSKSGAGAFMKKQVDARRLAQMMVGIGRRLDKRVQALITDMNQPLGYAIGNALEVMEVSQTLQNAGPADLTRLSLELAARMIFLGKITKTLDEARELAQAQAARRLRLSQVQGCDPGAGRQSAGARPLRAAAQRDRRARDLISRARATSARSTPKYIGLASSMIGAGRDTQGRHDRSGRRRDPRSEGRPEDRCRVQCCAASIYTSEEHLEEAAQLVEDAFRISAAAARRARTDPRSGQLRWPGVSMGTIHRPPRTGRHPCRRVSCSRRTGAPFKPRVIAVGLGLQFGFAFLVLKTRFRLSCFKAAAMRVNALLDYADGGQPVRFRRQARA